MSSLWHPHVKEAPLQGLTGMWGGVGSNLVSGAPGADGPYRTSNLYLRWDWSTTSNGSGYQEGSQQISGTDGTSRVGQCYNINACQYETDGEGCMYIGSSGGRWTNGVGSEYVPLTLEFWVKNHANCNGLVDTAPFQVDTIRMSTAGEVEWWGGGQDQNRWDGQTNKWMHLVYAFGRSGTTRSCSIFKNGQQVQSWTATGNQNVWNTFCIGSFNDGGNFQGDIGVVAVYNDQMNSGQVQDNFDALKWRYEDQKSW